MLAHIALAGLALAQNLASATPGVQVRVDSTRKEVVVLIGPLHIAPSSYYEHHAPETNLPFAWPVAGWVRGYRLDILDSAGRVMSRDLLHHAGMINLDRRQLVYPMVERLFAIGRETTPVMLPASMGLPLSPDQRMLVYYALVNPTEHAIDGASVRITLTWTPDRPNGPRNILPFFADANPTLGATRAFHVPPGRSTTSAEFTLPVGGHLRMLGGHVHDYAVEIRLEDATTNKVLTRLKTERNRDGSLRSIDRTRFLLKRKGLRLAPDRPYRVVSVYENPTRETIPLGAMAFLVGAFIPDDMQRWPAIDAANAVFQADLATLVTPSSHTHR